MTLRKVDASLRTTLVFAILAAIASVGIGLVLGVSPVVTQVVIVLWMLGAGLGMIDTAITLREAMAEREVADKHPVLIDIANANVRRECFRLLELAALFGIGVVALGALPSLVASMLLLYFEILLIANARLDRRERHNTDHLLRQARGQDGL
jgi:hypothetical protein